MKKVLPFVLLIVITLLVAFYYLDRKQPETANIPKITVQKPNNENKAEKQQVSKVATAQVEATNLNVPWEIAYLPSGDKLVTQRSGELLRIGAETKVLAKIQGVVHQGEGGLLGMALQPNFAETNFVFLYLTSRENGELTNRVERYKLVRDTLTDRKVILQGIKGSSNHDGGRIAFGLDGYLYVTTGDAEDENSAQDKNSLNGKILRIGEDGEIPPDNPFGNAVYSYGHRNPQGLAWDIKGRLWSTEHGPSGLRSGYDEINLIEKGANYGWPLVTGEEIREGLTPPKLHSGSDDTWAPSGLAYKDGSLFFAGLRGEALYEAKIEDNTSLSLSEHFKGQFGRIRAVVVGMDGNLHFSTSNTDGRGNPSEDDDKIFKVILN